jgi:PAS fold/GAF domain
MLDIIKNKIRRSLEGPGDRSPGTCLTHNSYENAALISTAFEHGIYGIALWDEEFNLITANSQYSDLHKIPKALLTPGTNLLTVMNDLKTRGVLTADTDPATLKAHISLTLATTGQLTSAIRFSDGTFLEISAERMSNGCIVAYLRNATREKVLAREAREKEKRTETYADAIASFAMPAADERAATVSARLNHVTETVATLLPVDWCVVWTKSDTLNEAAAASTYQRATQSHIDIENTVLPDLAGYLTILETSPVIAIDDLDKHAFGQVHGNRAPLDDYAYASIDIPFRQNGRIMGVLSCLDTQGARNWSAADKMFASAAASHIGSLMSSPEPIELWDLPTGEIYRGGQAAE